MFSMCSELTPRVRIPDTRIPQDMQPCADLGLTQIFSLLDNNNVPRNSQNIMMIKDHDDESKVFYEKPIVFTRYICNDLFRSLGPANPKYVNDTFLSWLNIDACQTNTRGLYCNILRCNYLSSELTAVKKTM